MKFEGEDYTLRKRDGEVLIRQWPARETMANPLWWITWTWQFFWRWLITRPLLPMTLALPAILSLGLLAAFATPGASIPKSMETNNYKRLLSRSMDNEDYSTAELSAEALVSLYPDSVEHQLNHALVLAKAGEPERASTIMEPLATEQGSARAAMWLADQVGELSQFTSWQPEQRDEFLEWLTLAIDNAPANPEPRKLKGQVLRAIGDFRGAYEALEPIADVDPNTTYLVTFLERQLGFEERATERASKLVKYFREVTKNDKTNVEARLQGASMLAISGKEVEALAFLKEGIRATSDPSKHAKLKSAIVETMVIKANRTLQEEPTPLELMQSLQLLSDAVMIDPNNQRLVESIAQACVQAAESKNNELVVLREALVRSIDGIQPDTSHFILGTIALREGDTKKASYHLEIAAKNNPQLPGILNNLADSLLREETPDLERALRLSNAAIRNMTKQPNHPYLRETRGQILLKMKRYADAISDLELALKAEELRPQVRESLAIAYEALGATEIATRQRQLKAQGK
ncbi:MAG: hypothetical protein AB8B50_04475 [Pirellulaceae bacterium]